MKSNTILILWSFQTSFIEAGVRELLDLGFSVTVVYQEINFQHPDQLNTDPRAERLFLDNGQLPSKVVNNEWDSVLVLGWAIPAYRNFCLKHKNSTRIMYMDNQFRGTPRQKFLSIFGRFIIPFLFDGAYVTGSRQVKYAGMIGFRNKLVLSGSAPFDEKTYYLHEEDVERNGPFVFVGRLSKEKGLDLLINGYRTYSMLAMNPRNLIIIGPEENDYIPDVPGVQVLGYMHAGEISKILQFSRAFVLPSRFEQWGVALIEAAACGNPLIATEEVGSSDEMILNQNGFIVLNRDQNALAQALLSIDAWDLDQMKKAANRSILLSQRFASNLWASRLVDMFARLASTQKSTQHKSTKKYMLYLTVVPDYRKVVFSILQNELSDDLEIYCAASSMDGELHSHREAKTVLRILSLREKVFFLSGRVSEAISVENLIVDLNPRALSSWYLLLIRRLKKRRTLVWGHVHPRTGSKSRMRHLRHLIMRLSDGVLVYTHDDLNWLQNRYPEMSLWVAPNALYHETDIAINNRKKRNDLVYVGRITKEKKVKLLIDGFIESNLADLGFTLVICGDGAEKKNLMLGSQDQVANGSIKFIDETFDTDRVKNIYSSAAVSISPGYAGLSITQSLGFGVPILVGDDEQHAPEIALAGETQLVRYFNSNSVSSLASELKKCVSFGIEHSGECLAAVEYVKQNYSAEKMAEGFILALRNIKDS